MSKIELRKNKESYTLFVDEVKVGCTWVGYTDIVPNKEFMDKKGERNHFFGKNHTEESTNKISKNRVGKACGENNSMSKKEHRESVSRELKKKYNSGELDFLKKIQSDNAFKNQANGKLRTAPISSAEK